MSSARLWRRLDFLLFAGAAALLSTELGAAEQNSNEGGMLLQQCEASPPRYPHLSHAEIFDSVELFYRRFYFRSGKIGDSTRVAVNW
jgi:hypothetical protein